jgi:DNA-directed RNA polymerase delta subunit
MSQVNMVYDILQKAGQPLHITEIIERVAKVYGQRLDRESIVSSLVKKVNRGDRFVRTEKNVFGLKEGK